MDEGLCLVIEGPWCSWGKGRDPTGEAPMSPIRGLQVAQSLRGQQRDKSAVRLSPVAAPASASARLQPCLPWALCSRPREAAAGTVGTAGHGRAARSPRHGPVPPGERALPAGAPLLRATRCAGEPGQPLCADSRDSPDRVTQSQLGSGGEGQRWDLQGWMGAGWGPDKSHQPYTTPKSLCTSSSLAATSFLCHRGPSSFPVWPPPFSSLSPSPKSLSPWAEAALVLSLTPWPPVPSQRGGGQGQPSKGGREPSPPDCPGSPRGRGWGGQ